MPIIVNVEGETCMNSLGEDVRLYGALLHAGFYLLFLAFIVTSYAHLYERCAASLSSTTTSSCFSSWTRGRSCSTAAAAAVDSFDWTWLKSHLRMMQRHCKLKTTLTTNNTIIGSDLFLVKVLCASNLLVVLMLMLDKHQALAGGYRISELLLLLCFNASGFLCGWPTLIMLNHKIKKPQFLLIAALMSLFSFVWPYLYFMLK
jgi:uncharacterized membrane protein YsdA (DUF1294 family)